MISDLAPRVLFIGLDGSDAATLAEMARSGRCPNVARLLEESAVVETVGPYGTFVGSMWKTMATGSHPHHHEYWNWAAIDSETYKVRHTVPNVAARPPFWEQLSEEGKRVAILDVPHSIVPESLNGVMLNEWGCHDRHFGTASHPPSVLEELDRTVGRHLLGCRDHPEGHSAFAPCDYTLREGFRRTVDEEREISNLIRAACRQKRMASTHLLKQGPWDLFMTVFGEGHCMGHQLWHLHDPRHVWHSSAAQSIVGDPMDEIYRELDDALGELLEHASDESTVYLFISHGMRIHNAGAHYLDEVLLRIDKALHTDFSAGRLSDLAGAVLARTPSKLRPAAHRIFGAAGRIKSRLHRPPESPNVTLPDPSRRFFQIYGDTAVAAIRFNVVGRESAGLVSREEFDPLRDVVTRELLGIIDIRTGRPVIRAVVRSEEVLDRVPGDTFPDLFIEWSGTNCAVQVWSPTVGLVYVPYDHWRSGDHTDRGLFAARGPGIRAGRLATRMSVADIAPTVAAALGVQLTQVDGSPWSDLVPCGVRTVGSAPVPPVRAQGSEPSIPRGVKHRRRESGSAARDIAVAASISVAELASRAERTEDTLTQMKSWIEGLTGRVDTLGVRTDELARASGGRHDEVSEVRRRLDLVERQLLVYATMDWLAREPVVDHPMISVITPTYRRPAYLGDAIASVISQRHQEWEMVVVDDGSHTAREVADVFDDARVRVIDAEHGGSGKARNVGLAHAKGEVIAYLDDDNCLHPGWLHAVAWAFRNHPEVDVLYGARVIDDDRRINGDGDPIRGFPWFHFLPFDRRSAEQWMMSDMGAIAHRAGLPEAQFDETLTIAADWDLLLALTVDRNPLELPALALYYSTESPDRMSNRDMRDLERIRQKWASPPATDT